MFRGERDVLLVSRQDGDWQFVCGKPDHHDPKEPYHVSVGILLERDPALQELASLPHGWEAERLTKGEQWLKTQSHFDT